MRKILLLCGLIMALALSGCGDDGSSSDSSGSSSGTLPAPTAVIANAASSVEIDLSWTGSAGAANYTLYRDGSSLGTISNTTFTDTGLTAGTTYCYTVAASDLNGNTSPQSAESCTSTVAAQLVNVTVETTSTGYEWTTTMDTFSVGYTYTFVITNNNSAVHEWMIMPRGSLDETQALVLVDNIFPGATVTQEYTFVPVTGDYEFACHLLNHYQLGLHRNITILP